ncbi:MAG: hypothetical protein IPN17_18765 [Deltaproteobacteria bacterium]|nr:hypothetical protein [Deltaproteobacteria bacterium]
MHTTLKFLIFAFAMLTACDGSDGNSGFDTFDEYMASRERPRSRCGSYP